jgi:integrase
VKEHSKGKELEYFGSDKPIKDVDGPAIQVFKVKLRSGIIEFPDQKNDKAESIALSPKTIEIISGIPPRIDSPYIFANKNGKPPADIKRGWGKALKAAKITDFRFHDLHHSEVSWLTMQGASAREVQEFLRHSSPAMAARYSHLSQQHKKESVMALEEAILGGRLRHNSRHNLKIVAKMMFGTRNGPLLDRA